MQAKVDADLCMGCSVCESVCPDAFEMDADNKAQVRVNPVPVELEQDCRDAADQCPEQAIQIVE
jgi:ferredoxin